MPTDADLLSISFSVSDGIRSEITSFSGFRAMNFAKLLTPPLLLIVFDFDMIRYIQKSISKIEYTERRIEKEMTEIENLTDTELGRVNDFVKAAFFLKEDELKVLDGQIPMTQELFDSLCDRLSEIGAQNEFFRLLNEYPDFLRNSADKIEEELESSNVELPEMTDEESKQSFQKLMEKINRESR